MGPLRAKNFSSHSARSNTQRVPPHTHTHINNVRDRPNHEQMRLCRVREQKNAREESRAAGTSWDFECAFSFFFARGWDYSPFGFLFRPGVSGGNRREIKCVARNRAWSLRKGEKTIKMSKSVRLERYCARMRADNVSSAFAWTLVVGYLSPPLRLIFSFPRKIGGGGRLCVFFR